MFPSFDGEGEAASLSPPSLPQNPPSLSQNRPFLFEDHRSNCVTNPFSLSLSPRHKPLFAIPNKLKKKMEIKKTDHPPPFRRSQITKIQEVSHPWWLQLRSSGTTTVLITHDKLLVMCIEYLEEREELIQALRKDRKFFDLPNITQAIVGPCKIAKPRGWSPVEQSKWTRLLKVDRAHQWIWPNGICRHVLLGHLHLKIMLNSELHQQWEEKF